MDKLRASADALATVQTEFDSARVMTHAATRKFDEAKSALTIAKKVFEADFEAIYDEIKSHGVNWAGA